MEPRIHGGRVMLTAWSDDDAGALAAVLETSRDHIASWMPGAAADLRDPERFLAAAARAWKDDTVYCYAIRDAAGALSGHISCKPEGSTAEVGYWVRVESVGRGLATAALLALCEHAFAAGNALQEIRLSCDAENIASVRVAQKAGFDLIAERSRPKRTPVESDVEHVWAKRRP